MITPITLTDPFNTTWYHGTDTNQFETWKLPPPRRSPADIAHTGLFFAADRDFAKRAGQNVCSVTLVPHTKLLAPAKRGAESTALRKAVINSHPLAQYCQCLANDVSWTTAWSTGEVMRFNYDQNNSKAVQAIGEMLAASAAGLKNTINAQVSDELLMKAAQHNFTRGWIEQLVREAKKLGYQAIQGAEIDKWSFPESPPIAQPWLVVMDGSVITAPAWL